MARGGVYAEIFGDKHTMHTMDSWAVRASNSVPAFEAMHEYLLGVEEELFETEGASGADGAWANRSNNFRHQNDHPILQLTGQLMQSLSDSGHPDHQWVVTPRGFSFGTRDPKAKYHQTGTEFIEQRKVIDLTIENRTALVEILHMWVTRAGLKPERGGRFFSSVRGAGGRFIG